MNRRALCRMAAGLALVFSAGCAAPPETVAVKRAAPAIPESFYREAAAQGQLVLAVDAEHSWVVVQVYRAGPLARFGHDHVVASRQVRGYALLPGDYAGARADLYLAAEALAVDEPVLRAQEGLAGMLAIADIEATRRNMLDSVLEARRFPHVLVHATCATAGCAELEAQVTLHGVTRQVRIPVTLTPGNERWTVSGGFHLRLTDFGMVPYSALGGALRVADRIDLRFRLEATPLRAR